MVTDLAYLRLKQRLWTGGNKIQLKDRLPYKKQRSENLDTYRILRPIAMFPAVSQNVFSNGLTIQTEH